MLLSGVARVSDVSPLSETLGNRKQLGLDFSWHMYNCINVDALKMFVHCFSMPFSSDVK